MSAHRGSAAVDRGSVAATMTLDDLDTGIPKAGVARFGRLERPIQMVRLAEIVQDSPLQSRQETFDADKHPEDTELLHSIQENGVLEPIMLKRLSGIGEAPAFEIVFGHRRKEAAALAGLNAIPAILTREGDEVGVLTLAENTGGRSLTAYEKAMGLVRAKELAPGTTQMELARRAGISQGAVSNLLKAYEESTPALRGLFAEGMDARAIVELQPAFAGMPENEQAEVAHRLRGASQQEAQGVRALVEQGLDPAAAVGSALVPGRGTSARAAEDARSAGRGETGRSQAKIAHDGKQLKALAEYTGAPLRSVKGLAEKAIIAGAGMDVLTLACAYVGHGGAERNALRTGAYLAKDRKLVGLVKKQLELERKARQLIGATKEPRVREILTAFFSVERSRGTAR